MRFADIMSGMFDRSMQKTCSCDDDSSLNSSANYVPRKTRVLLFVQVILLIMSGNLFAIESCHLMLFDSSFVSSMLSCAHAYFAHDTLVILISKIFMQNFSNFDVLHHAPLKTHFWENLRAKVRLCSRACLTRDAQF